MIKDEPVKIKWHYKNREHYESFGYKFTRYGDVVAVDVKHLTHGSSFKITAICEMCGKERKIQYILYKDLCFSCARAEVSSRPGVREARSDRMKRLYSEYKDLLDKLNIERRGTLSPNWKHEKTDEERRKDRKSPEDYEWAKNVKIRDNFTCQVCKSRGVVLNSHHLMAYASYPELRFEASNGICLCEVCHKNFHNKYGKGNNTKQQFEEFKGLYEG